MVMVLHKRILRALAQNKAQYIGSILLIVLSCFMFLGMTLVGSNLQRLTDEFKLHNVQEDAAFTTDQAISGLEDLESTADAVIEESKTLDYALAEGKTLRIFSKNEKINLPAIIDGKELRGRGELLLNPAFAAANSYKIGDMITIAGQSFTVSGFMALPNYIYPLQSETDLMYSQQNFGIAVISREDFAALKSGSRSYSVKFNHKEKSPRVQSAQFRALLLDKGIGIVQWTDIGDNKRVSSVTLKLQAINSMSKAMPIAILLLSILLISNVIGRLIKGESAIIGALYALGYRRNEIYRHYLIFPIVIAGTGAAIGTVLGLFVVRPMVVFMVSAFSMPLNGIEFQPIVIILSFLLPILIIGCSVWWVMRKELRRSPVELMRGDRQKSKINCLERIFKLEKLKFSAKFKIREQMRSLSRLTYLLVGCIVATMLLLYGFTIKSSLEYFTNNGMTDTLRFQYEYKFKRPHNEGAPIGAEPFSSSLFLPEDENGKEFFVVGVLPNSAMLSLADESGSALNTGKVIITKPLADKLKVKKNDTVKLIRELDGRTYSVKIDSIADTYVGKYIFIPLSDYNAKFEMPAGSYLGLWSTAPLDFAQDQLYSTKSIDESIAAVKESTASVQTMIGMYAALAFLIGIIIIYLVTSMVIEENKSSISLLRIFGYRKREVNSLILNSSTFVVVLGYILGIPMILLSMGGLLRSLDNSVGLTLPLRINPLYIGVGFVVVLLSYELSKLLCKKKVNAVPMSEILKASMD